MSNNIFDTWTKSGRLLQAGYERLTAVDYDPGCEMVDVINDYDDLPDLENELEDATLLLDAAEKKVARLSREFAQRYAELETKIETAEVTVLEGNWNE